MRLAIVNDHFAKVTIVFDLSQIKICSRLASIQFYLINLLAAVYRKSWGRQKENQNLIHMKKKFFFQTSVIVLFVSLLSVPDNSSFAQTAIPDSTKKSFRLFEDENLIEISLAFDLSTYFRTKPKDNYLNANITFHLSKTDSITRDIKLKTRGIFRNRYCMFAPIELNFNKVDFGYSDLNKISKLKLVPQCSSGKDKEDYVLREFLAYKLFNVLTDTSFRVRLLTVKYFDSQKKRKPVIQYGFFIEPVEMLTARTNTIRIKSKMLNQKSIVPKIMDRIALFNFMIGNYDWSVPGQHNIQVIKSLVIDPNGLGIGVPHDFDWSGLVNPTYAIPTEEVGTDNVRERLFLGVCRSKEVFQSELSIFLEKQAEFYKVINEFPYVSQKVKKDIISYLDGFFNQLAGKRDRILYDLMSTCKKI